MLSNSNFSEKGKIWFAYWETYLKSEILKLGSVSKLQKCTNNMEAGCEPEVRALTSQKSWRSFWVKS